MVTEGMALCGCMKVFWSRMRDSRTALTCIRSFFAPSAHWTFTISIHLLALSQFTSIICLSPHTPPSTTSKSTPSCILDRDLHTLHDRAALPGSAPRKKDAQGRRAESAWILASLSRTSCSSFFTLVSRIETVSRSSRIVCSFSTKISVSTSRCSATSTSRCSAA